MTSRIVRAGLGAWLLLSGILAAAAENGSLVIRAVLHDPVNPGAELFVADPSGQATELNLRRKALAEPQQVGVINGTIILLSSATADPAKPGKDLAAIVRIPPSLKRAILLVIPAPPGSKQTPKYRAVVIDDSPEHFPKGSSRVVNGTAVDIAVKAGEHNLAAKPGKILTIPPVVRKNEFNLAQTNFYFRKSEQDQWEAFVERQSKYLDTIRRIFIVHVTPGATAPAVSTIVDTVKPKLPQP